MSLEVLQMPIEPEDPRKARLLEVEPDQPLAVVDYGFELPRLLLVVCDDDNQGVIYQSSISGPLQGKSRLVIPGRIFDAMRQDEDSAIRIEPGGIHAELYKSELMHRRRLFIKNTGSRALRADT